MEQLQNGYQMEIEQKWNSYDSQKWKKSSPEQTIREHVLQNTC